MDKNVISFCLEVRLENNEALNEGGKLFYKTSLAFGGIFICLLRMFIFEKFSTEKKKMLEKEISNISNKF